ncbi:hypothetical protein ACFFQW_35775 [Umezawaea endophytica]|uniref:GLTT repeat-containing protein n=1 Tax=Umezawaea endophytica TaxID=1654476 RepID=A0A9X2VUZ1_9PSEU|nr:hypothetical protein [Umezawaea endophytica]MCS7483215.1 hypothetical protein [Umezawaea endophytica]
MFRTRPRGSLRAAALLAVGASPLLAGVAAAAPAPSLDGLEGAIGAAPELTSTVAGQAGQVASGRSVKLPAPTDVQDSSVARQPAPQLPDPSQALPNVSTPVLPGFGQPQGRSLPGASSLPIGDQLQLNQLPLNQLPSTGELPLVSQLGNLPVALPGLG